MTSLKGAGEEWRSLCVNAIVNQKFVPKASFAVVLTVFCLILVAGALSYQFYFKQRNYCVPMYFKKM